MTNNTSISSDIKDFHFSKAEEYNNFIKNNTHYLDNQYFVIKNLEHSNLKFKQYPPHIKNNPLFLLEYFSRKTVDPKEYCLISFDLLANTMFINSVIRHNPDIYLLAAPSAINETTYHLIKDWHPHSHLKYAPAHLLADFDYCEKSVSKNNSNFRYLSDQFKEDWRMTKLVFKTHPFNQENPLVAYLTENQKNNHTFLMDLLDYNKGVFPFLPKQYHQNKEILNKVIKFKSEYFKFVPKPYLEDQEWVHSVLNSWKIPPTSFKDTFLSFKFIHILKDLPLSYFTEDFCEQYDLALGKGFTQLPSTHTSHPNILRSAFSHESIKNNLSNIDTAYLNHVKDLKVKVHLKDIFKRHNRNSSSFNINELTSEVQQFLKSFWLFDKLDSQIEKKTSIEKKNKI